MDEDPLLVEDFTPKVVAQPVIVGFDACPVSGGTLRQMAEVGVGMRVGRFGGGHRGQVGLRKGLPCQFTFTAQHSQAGYRERTPGGAFIVDRAGPIHGIKQEMEGVRNENLHDERVAGGGKTDHIY